jgi:hypothetical protein
MQQKSIQIICIKMNQGIFCGTSNMFFGQVKLFNAMLRPIFRNQFNTVLHNNPDLGVQIWSFLSKLHQNRIPLCINLKYRYVQSQPNQALKQPSISFSITTECISLPKCQFA